MYNSCHLGYCSGLSGQPVLPKAVECQPTDPLPLCPPRLKSVPHALLAPKTGLLSVMVEGQLGAATPPWANEKEGRNMIMATGSRTGWAGLWSSISLCKSLRQLCSSTQLPQPSQPAQQQNTPTLSSWNTGILLSLETNYCLQKRKIQTANEIPTVLYILHMGVHVPSAFTASHSQKTLKSSLNMLTFRTTIKKVIRNFVHFSTEAIHVIDDFIIQTNTVVRK